MKLAHISDLHFSKWNWSPAQFFSKRWLGNLNFLFGRKRTFSHERLDRLASVFKEQGVTHVLVTGDLTTTSTPTEFKKAQAFIQELQKEFEVFCIPGNHDHYTKSAYRLKLFYDYFPASWEKESPYNLKDHGITTKKLKGGWHFVGLDTALATSWFFSSGYFFEKTEQALVEFLSSLPSHEQVILFNHFPFFQHESRRKRLDRGDALKRILHQFPQVKLYCHGHTHRHCLADLQPSKLPIILDSGSTAHTHQGSWHLLDLSSQNLTIEVYGWEKDSWKPTRQETYDLV